MLDDVAKIAHVHEGEAHQVKQLMHDRQQRPATATDDRRASTD